MQLIYLPSHLFELLILNLIEPLLHALEVLLIPFVRITHKLLHTRILHVLLAPYHSGYLELFLKPLKYRLHPVQVALILQSYQCQLLVQRILHVLLDLLTGHHAVVHLELYVVDLLAELVVQVVRRVPVPPTHRLQVCRLLREVRRQVLLHALNQLLQLLLFLREVLVCLGERRCQLASGGVRGVAHLTHFLVLGNCRINYGFNCLNQANWDVQPAVRVQTLKRVRHLVGVSRFTVVCHCTSYQILS